MMSVVSFSLFFFWSVLTGKKRDPAVRDFLGANCSFVEAERHVHKRDERERENVRIQI